VGDRILHTASEQPVTAGQQEGMFETGAVLILTCTVKKAFNPYPANVENMVSF